jgi:hypothetical protein
MARKPAKKKKKPMNRVDALRALDKMARAPGNPQAAGGFQNAAQNTAQPMSDYATGPQRQSGQAGGGAPQARGPGRQSAQPVGPHPQPVPASPGTNPVVFGNAPGMNLAAIAQGAFRSQGPNPNFNFGGGAATGAPPFQTNQ